MTLNEIYDRLEELLAILKKNPEDQNCLFECEREISFLEQLREELEEGL